MTLRGKLTKIMVKTAPEVYRKYVVIEKEKMVLYVQLLKALYGCLHRELLFYRKLLTDLESRGFKINPYDKCVVNKTIDGKQFNITWHVDDLKLSHVDKKVVYTMIGWMKGLYGQYIIISRGKNHYKLGMIIELSVRGQAAVIMVDYLKGVISYLEEVEILTGTATSPAAENLYATRSDQKKLDDKQARTFHHAVSQLIFSNTEHHF